MLPSSNTSWIILLAIVLSFAASCSRVENTAQTVRQKPALTKADSLWLADDYTELGFDQYSYEDYDSGLEYFNLALQYNPSHSQAWHGRALMLDQLRRDLDAEYAYKQAEHHDSRNKQAIWHLGCHYARHGEKEKALRQLRAVIALDSGYAVGVRTEDCWISLWDDPDFLKVVGVLK